MQAKFIRGQDPKAAMGIGDKNARIFEKALMERDYYAEVIENMIDGLISGSIKERDAVRFIQGGIRKHYPNKTAVWHNWYFNNNDTFWADDIEKFIISFDMPLTEFSENLQYRTNQARTIRCSINRYSESDEGSYYYEINTFCQINTYDRGTNIAEEHFPQHNIFLSGDHTLTTRFIINSISRVVEAAIKNIG